MRFNLQKSWRVPLSFFKKRKEISGYLTKIKRVLADKDYSVSESFLILPQEQFSFKNLSKKFDLILLVGIGGSSLGAQAIFEALKNTKPLKELLVLDSLNPFFFRKVLEKAKALKKRRLAVCYVSKSGKTFETNANFLALWPAVQKNKPRVFVISDQGSVLWNFGKQKGFSVFPIPQKVGGRYSVFSNAGLLPLTLAGVNIKDLLLGAKQADKICLTDDPLKNPALASALTIFYHWQKGKNIYDNLVFPPDLGYFGRWYQQLMAESLGKKGKGITPTITISTTDFHSLGQLYFEGPKDKLFNFIFVEKLGNDDKGRKLWRLNKVIFEGMKKAYYKKGLPFGEIVLPELNERNLGFLMQMKMIEIILLAKLMKVNSFNQPGVELYKKETRKILKKNNDQYYN